MNDKTYKLVCKSCGGMNIQCRAWVDPNSDDILDSCSDGYIEDNWCNDCENHVNFEIIELDDNK